LTPQRRDHASLRERRFAYARIAEQNREPSRLCCDYVQHLDGLALAPDRPGHGIEFDWKALDGVRASG